MQSKNLEAYFAARSTRSASSLDQIARALRAKGMLPAGARGRHAPRLGPDDIARFVVAASMAPTPAEAVQTVDDFGALLPIHKIKGMPLKLLNQMGQGAAPPYTFGAYLTCIFWAGWEDAQEHIRSITLRRRPPHSELLYRFDAEVAGAEGWGMIFEGAQKKSPPEGIVRHNHAEDTLLVETVLLGPHFLRGLFEAARQIG